MNAIYHTLFSRRLGYSGEVFHTCSKFKRSFPGMMSHAWTPRQKRPGKEDC